MPHVRKPRMFKIRRGSGAVLVTGAIVLLAAGLAAPAAHAADPNSCGSTWNGDAYDLDVNCNEGGSTTTPADPAPTPAGDRAAPTSHRPRPKPPCELSGAWSFCDGPRPCLYTSWNTSRPLPAGPRPKGATAWIVMCRDGRQGLGIAPTVTFTPVWRTPPQIARTEPPLIVQARQAVGHLHLPRVGLTFNPPGQTIVGIDTWWWATGPGATPRHGTSAFGLVATARPTGLDIDPGDGSDTLHCPYTTTKTAAERHCASAYTRSSVTGTADYHGQPAYTATATPTWTITFTNDGTPITFPGFDTTVAGPPARATVPVAEVQTIVTGTG
jgi:hypothetical protein